MLIDWFTVGAQVLNFAILVWLLKRYLYQPILDAIDARERRIAAELRDADTKKAEALRERDEFRLKNEQFDRERAALLGAASDAAKLEGRRLLDTARRDADALSAKRGEMLRSDAEQLNELIRRRIEDEVFAVARKALQDLAAADLEPRIVEIFVERLRTMDAATRASLGAAVKATSAPAVVRSAFTLSPAQCTAVRQALDAALSGAVDVRFEIAPGIVAGIEFTSNGRRIAWSVADYLTSMQSGVGKLLEPA
jgi:F-type H+-transporting ATPase subunit b